MDDVRVHRQVHKVTLSLLQEVCLLPKRHAHTFCQEKGHMLWLNNSWCVEKTKEQLRPAGIAS